MTRYCALSALVGLTSYNLPTRYTEVVFTAQRSWKPCATEGHADPFPFPWIRCPIRAVKWLENWDDTKKNVARPDEA
jgi:hypothetical protein